MRFALKISVLLLFLVHYGNTIFYSHVHYTQAGAVTHSHPYTNGNGHHSHSSTEMQTISLLSLLLLLAVASTADRKPLQWLLYTLLPKYQTPVSHRPEEHFSLRAPPAFI